MMLLPYGLVNEVRDFYFYFFVIVCGLLGELYPRTCGLTKHKDEYGPINCLYSVRARGSGLQWGTP